MALRVVVSERGVCACVCELICVSAAVQVYPFWMAAVMAYCNVRHSNKCTLQTVTRFCSILTTTLSTSPTLHTISSPSEQKPGESIYYSFLLSLPGSTQHFCTQTHRCCTDKFRFLMEPVKRGTCATLPWSLKTSFYSPSLSTPPLHTDIHTHTHTLLAQESLLDSGWIKCKQRVLAKGGGYKKKQKKKHQSKRQINVLPKSCR